MNNLKHNDNQWDSNDSTFHQLIHLTNGLVLHGYSKKKLAHENNHKPNLLVGMILRMGDKGYLTENDKRTTPIHFIEYREHSRDQPLFRLCYDRVDFLDLKFESSPFYMPVNEFLKQFYRLKLSNISIDEIYNMLYPSGRYKADHLFDVSKCKFPNFKDLQLFVEDLLPRKIYPEGQIIDFATKYSLKHFGQTPNFRNND